MAHRKLWERVTCRRPAHSATVLWGPLWERGGVCRHPCGGAELPRLGADGLAEASPLPSGVCCAVWLAQGTPTTLLMSEEILKA